MEMVSSFERLVQHNLYEFSISAVVAVLVAGSLFVREYRDNKRLHLLDPVKNASPNTPKSMLYNICLALALGVGFGIFCFIELD